VPQLPATVYWRLESQLGPIARIQPVAGASQGQVFIAEGDRGRFAVKLTEPPVVARERRMLGMLAARGLAVPILLGGFDDTPALVTVWVEGASADPADVSAQRRAGAWLARLHELPVEPTEADAMPWAEALPRRRDAWLQRGRGRLSDQRLTAIASRLDDSTLTAIASRLPERVWCHRDFEPRNWRLETRTGLLRVLDFGQARPDAWLLDLVKLAEGAWAEHPPARAAFFEGYGRTLDEAERHALARLGLLHGLQTCTWGHEHSDVGLTALGETIIARHLG
jgi:aminoglycoside phosphotransferase (APT) family kinase protein